jgi:hypothetical protein
MSPIGRGMTRAGPMEEYIEMHKYALYEIKEVLITAEFDDYMNDAVLIAEAMKPELEQVLKMIESGGNEFDSQFSFMQNINQMPTEIVPFKHLLLRINDTQKNGLQE